MTVCYLCGRPGKSKRVVTPYAFPGGDTQRPACSECRLTPFFEIEMLRKLMLEQVAAND